MSAWLHTHIPLHTILPCLAHWFSIVYNDACMHSAFIQGYAQRHPIIDAKEINQLALVACYVPFLFLNHRVLWQIGLTLSFSLLHKYFLFPLMISGKHSLAKLLATQNNSNTCIIYLSWIIIEYLLESRTVSDFFFCLSVFLFRPFWFFSLLLDSICVSKGERESGQEALS